MIRFGHHFSPIAPCESGRDTRVGDKRGDLARSSASVESRDASRRKPAGGLVAFSATPVVAAETEPRIGFMEIKRNGSQPSGKGSADYFTGTVRIDPLFQASEPARGTGASVTFEPGARTAWHTHPLGQTLIVTTGVGRVQRWGGPVEEIWAGDAVWFPPGEKHWHGASRWYEHRPANVHPVRSQ
jgi:quercetin dioxygenase-like cupin family protein